MSSTFTASCLLLLLTAAEPPRHEAELVFPLHAEHNHAPGIVECPNGDLLVSWYRGSGERRPTTWPCTVPAGEQGRAVGAKRS